MWRPCAVCLSTLMLRAAALSAWTDTHRDRGMSTLPSYFRPSAFIPNWPLLSPLPRQESSSNWVGSRSHVLWSQCSPLSWCLSLPPGNQGKEFQSMPWNHACCTALAPPADWDEWRTESWVCSEPLCHCSPGPPPLPPLFGRTAFCL